MSKRVLTILAAITLSLGVIGTPAARADAPTVSGVSSVTPSPAVVLTLAQASIPTGGSTTATVTVSPAWSGNASFQVLSGSTWVTTSTVAVKSGTATVALKPGVNRSYRVIAQGVASAAVTLKVVASAVPSAFTVRGAGWGHGVGMSQYGAKGMAAEGKTAAQILTYYYTGTTVKSVPAARDLRVQVFGSGSDSTTSVDLVVRSPGSDSVFDGQWRMQFSGAGTTTPATEWTGINNEDLMISRNGQNIMVRREDGTVGTAAQVTVQWEGTSYYQSTSTEDPYVELLNREGGAAQTHGQYRHGQLLLSVLNGRINIVNVLDLNTEYLYGIAEVPSSWPAAALGAQAITARGYALRAEAAGLKAACGCHVYDDTRSQNFTGWKKENEGADAIYGKRWVAAVTATNANGGADGQVVATSSGAIATTYYFSSSGGQTENSEKVWSSAVAYLKSVPDPWSVDPAVGNSNASWTATLTQAKAATAFGLPNVATIAITTRTSAASTAAAYTLTATSSTGQKATLTGADKIRIALGVKSPWIRSIAAG